MEATASQERDWSSLTVDLLLVHILIKHLRWSSHPNFGLVCRQWQSARSWSPFYPAWLTPLLLNATDVGTTNMRYYSPYCQKHFEAADTLDMPGAGAKICCFTGNRLTLCLKHSILEAELLNGREVCELPPISNTRFDLVVYDGVRRMMLGVDTAFGMLNIARCTRNDSTGTWGGYSDFTWHDPGRPRFPASPDCNPI